MKIARKKGGSILFTRADYENRIPEIQSFLEACLQRQQRAMTCFAFKHGQDSVALFIESVSLQSLASVTVQIVEMFHLRIKMRKT